MNNNVPIEPAANFPQAAASAKTAAGLPSSLPAAASSGRVFRGDLNIRIDRDGVWYFEGSRIGRKEIVCLFASVLERDSQGQYWLVTPTEIGSVEVEDVPFLAVELFHARPEREQVISFRTNVDEIVTVGSDHPLYVLASDTAGPVPYVVVRPGIAARLSRAVYYEMIDLGVVEDVDGAPVFGVWSNRSFFPLGSPDDAP